MIYKLILILAGLFGIYRVFRTNDIFALLILGGQIISIGLVLISDQIFKSVGSWIFMFTLVLAIIYGLSKKDFKNSKRAIIIIPTAFLIFIHMIPILHENQLRVLALGLILPIIALIVLVLKDIRNYKNEIGFLTIIAAGEISEIYCLY
jgi:hypothetical protein